MGRYVDGKWEPTWGDDQFGVVDSPAEMYNKNRELSTRIAELEAERDQLRAALLMLIADIDDLCAQENCDGGPWDEFQALADEYRANVEPLKALQ